ncbi:hypothetical protein Tco_0079141 [Tanacetum coccineum]
MELQKTQTILKRKNSENKDKYHDTVLDLEAKAKEKENAVLKIRRSLQAMFMLGPKPMSFYDPNLKHDLEDTKDILDDATKSQKKMDNKFKDPIAIKKKQNVPIIDYNKLNALYRDFIPQKELSAEQKYFSSTFIPSENPSNASTPTSSSKTKPHLNTAYPLPSDTAYPVLCPIQPPTESNLSITSNNINIELSKEFLVELRKNIYHGTYNGDVVDHIVKVLKMVDLSYIPGVDSHQLRMKVFPLSLADDAKEWWISEEITTWEELVEKLFCRFYPESYDGEDEMLDEGEN